jgi:phage-related protein
MLVRFTHEAWREFHALPLAEREAMRNAIGKLEQAGELLAYPHSSSVRGTAKLRELRPRAGRSSWRGFYRRIQDEIVIGAFGPEAQVDPSGFAQAVRAAEERLDADEARI